jgi:four helix bundle protein
MPRDYRKIKAWELADDLAVLVYQVTEAFPSRERYSLVEQMRKSAVSVAANIAEGSARETQRDYLHFLVTARASLSELGYYVHLTQRLGFLQNGQAEKLDSFRRETAYTLQGLIRSVRQQI